jgi:hypothetical protein
MPSQPSHPHTFWFGVTMMSTTAALSSLTRRLAHVSLVQSSLVVTSFKALGAQQWRFKSSGAGKGKSNKKVCLEYGKCVPPGFSVLEYRNCLCVLSFVSSHNSISLKTLIRNHPRICNTWSGSSFSNPLQLKALKPVKRQKRQ